jgi:hypothetical protein
VDHHTSAIRAIVATEAGFVQPGVGGSRRGGGDGGSGGGGGGGDGRRQACDWDRGGARG